MGKDRNTDVVLVRKLKKINHLECLDVEGRLILKWTSMK
jgi:hypothetical protein